MGKAPAGVRHVLVEGDRLHDVAERRDSNDFIISHSHGKPVHQSGLAPPIRNDALKNEESLIVLDPAADLEHWCLMTREATKHAVADPLGEGVLRPEELPFGPAVFLLPGLFHGIHDQLAIGRQLDLVLVVAELLR